MHASPSTRPDLEADRRFPAYGPIEAALGYGMFYLLVDRATPTVVEVFSERVLDLSPSFVRFGLAAALWFVLVVTVIDQVRRQLAALGVVTHDAIRPNPWFRGVPSAARAMAYLGGLILGGVVAVVTFGPGIDAAVSLIPVVATVDVEAFVLEEFLVMAVFFVAYSVATRSVDRLLVGGVRALLWG